MLEAEQSFLSFSELCRRHGISRPAGHKWLRRYREKGLDGLQDRSHRPHSCPLVPSADSIHRVLERHGCIEHRKLRRRRTHPGPPVGAYGCPEFDLTADSRASSATLDGALCYPLTVQDGCSRFLLSCEALPRLDLRQTRRGFELLFREYGLPERIRTDNGHPFASNVIGRLSRLSVWWIQLGVVPELIEPVSHSRTAATDACTAR